MGNGRERGDPVELMSEKLAQRAAEVGTAQRYSEVSAAQRSWRSVDSAALRKFFVEKLAQRCSRQ